MVDEANSNANGAVGTELLGRLFDRHAAVLELYARQFCDCPEDVVQETLIELAGQPHAPDDPAAWLFRVVRNKAISVWRSIERRKRHERAAAGQRSEWFEPSAADPIDAQTAAAAARRAAVGAGRGRSKEQERQHRQESSPGEPKGRSAKSGWVGPKLGSSE